MDVFPGVTARRLTGEEATPIHVRINLRKTLPLHLDLSTARLAFQSSKAASILRKEAKFSVHSVAPLQSTFSRGQASSHGEPRRFVPPSVSADGQHLRD